MYIGSVMVAQQAAQKKTRDFLFLMWLAGWVADKLVVDGIGVWAY